MYQYIYTVRRAMARSSNSPLTFHFSFASSVLFFELLFDFDIDTKNNGLVLQTVHINHLLSLKF